MRLVTLYVTLLSFAVVTVVWIVALVVCTGKILQADDSETAAAYYGRALNRSGKAFGIAALWAFGLRFSDIGNAIVYLIDGVESLL